MKKFNLAALTLALGGVMLVVSPLTQAVSQGTITFKGTISTGTCETNVDGQGANALIQMPDVTVSDFYADGVTPIKGPTSFVRQFNIDATACTINGNVSTYFSEESGLTLVDLNTGRLKNSITGSNGAKNVSLEILDAENGYAGIKVNQDQSSNLRKPVTGPNGKATLVYAARYYVDTSAPVVNGDFETKVHYVVQYK